MNKQEILAAAVAELRTFADAIDARDGIPSGDEQAGLITRMTAVKDAKKGVEDDAQRRNDLASAKAFMAQLGAPEEGGDLKSSKQGVGSFVRPDARQVKTFGQLFTESGAYTEFVGKYARNGVIPNDFKGLTSGQFKGDMKALVTGGSSTSGGAMIDNDVYATITDLAPFAEPTMRDVVTVSSTVSDTVEYVRVVSKTNNAATVAEATSAASPTAPGGAGALVLDPLGGYKPESGMTLERVSTSVKTLAHWIPVTKRAVADAGQIRTLIDTFLREGLVEKLDAQMLTGNGAGENLTGILNTAGILTVPSAGTDIDAIVDAIRTVRVTGRRRPTAMVIHPNDWYSAGFLLAKDSQLKYLIGDPRAGLDQLNALWGLTVVVSDAITENTALVGDFRYAVLWEREGVNVMVSDQHADFFIRNLLAILAEMRAAFGVLDPQAFCTVTAV